MSDDLQIIPPDSLLTTTGGLPPAAMSQVGDKNTQIAHADHVVIQKSYNLFANGGSVKRSTGLIQGNSWQPSTDYYNLERLLEDILAPSQYDANVEIANGKRVEFVIRLPGSGDAPLLLPIDSKFPIEDYNRLLDAEDKASIDEARKSLAAKIRVFAKDIHDKYIVPPLTTDFALMFLPTEGLYAEVVQNAALFEELRDKYKVTVVGATTLSAFLSSLQMGFKTLAIEHRSQEVWDTLRTVKKQFGEFETLLSQAHKQLQTVDNTIEKLVGTRARAINRALREVEVLSEAAVPLALEAERIGDDEY